MLKTFEILDEKNKILRKISKEVLFPLKKEDKKNIKNMVKYLRSSQNEKLAERHNLRPGMGLAAVQLGSLKRYFVVVFEEEDESFSEYVLINPKLLSHSEELIYAELGEGCLSINREVEGAVPRYARVLVEGYNEYGEKIKYRVREEVAIAFQHELDHLEGILFVDKIDKKDPFKNINNMREI